MLIKTDAPSPQRYNVPSKDFSDTKKGFIFGISREKYEKVTTNNDFKMSLGIHQRAFKARPFNTWTWIVQCARYCQGGLDLKKWIYYEI
jgi:hypothetical protein